MRWVDIPTRPDLDYDTSIECHISDWGAAMPRDAGTITPGEWIEEIRPPRRRMQVMAIHQKPGFAAPNVELAIEGNPVDRLTLSLFALGDNARFRRLQ